MRVEFQRCLITTAKHHCHRCVLHECQERSVEPRRLRSSTLIQYFSADVLLLLSFVVAGVPCQAYAGHHPPSSETASPADCRPAALKSSTAAAAFELEIETLLSDLDPTSKRATASVPVLLAALRTAETNSGLRGRSAMMLGRIGEPARSAVPLLIGILEDSSTGSAVAITSDDLENGSDPRYWSMKSLGLFGPVAADAVPAVRAFLISPGTSPLLRLLAADTLGQIRSPAAIGTLTEQLQRPRRNNSYEETMLRRTFIDGLALAGPQAVGALPALSRATEDVNVDVRRSACQTIGALGPRAEGALTPLVDRLILDDDPAVKDAAANALARLGAVAIPALIRLLEGGDADVQGRAAGSLGQMGQLAKSSQPQLRRMLQSMDSSVRLGAAEALLLISRDAGLVASGLLQELSSPDRQIRRRAAELLIQIVELPGDVSNQLETLAGGDNSGAGRVAAYVLRERSRRSDQ
ncbi:MAG: HEAT repeat domain-containing protein [Planctomycetota bacterium]|nr:HEAT repeat domain-containing protein [Planctomycetota bacterium]